MVSRILRCRRLQRPLTVSLHTIYLYIITCHGKGSGIAIKNDPDKKEVSKLWKEMRAWKDKYYPETVLISE